MKPRIESISSKNNFNWMVKEYCCSVPKTEFQCPWHYHSEYELVIYRDPWDAFQGTCFVGDYIGPITHNTLVLYGPGLPHMVAGNINGSQDKPQHSLIFWFSHAWVESILSAAPEFALLKNTLRRSGHGLQFSKATSDKIYQLLSGIDELAPHHQFLRLMESLTLLADDNQSVEMSARSYGATEHFEDDEQHKKVELARQYLEKNYQDPIKIRDCSRVLHMSESSVYRLFERHFNESFSEHLKSFRIGKACELLVNSQVPISLVAEQSGFTNLSNFNRQFKTIKGMTPRDFRVQFNR